MMNYKLNPTLKDRALTTVAVAIWNQDNLKILSSCEFYLRNDLELAEVKAREKAAKLLLPSSLNKELLNIINIIRLDLRTWVNFHGRFGNYFGANSPGASKFEFHWTAYGTVDRKRTAEAIIEDENVNTLTRYKYACTYCLESSIRNLWGKLDERSTRALKRTMQIEVGRQQVDLFPELSIHKDQVLIFWSFIMDSETNNRAWDASRFCFPSAEDITTYRYPFEGALFGGNEIALKYFLHKMSPEEKEKFLFKAVNWLAVFANLKFSRLKRSCKMYYTNVLCFLLSSMNEAQQAEIFKKHARQVLYCLLEWPWQEFFISTAEHVMEYLSPENLQFLLYQLINPAFVMVYRDFNYQSIFQKLWELSPSTHKKYVLDGPICEIFNFSLEIGQEQNILLMMKDVTPEQKQMILHSCVSLCHNLIKKEKISLLKLFLQQCIPPNKESKVAELNARLVSFSSTDMASKRIEKCKLSQFIFDFVTSFSKRKLLKGDEIPFKKICVKDEENE